MDTFDAFRQLIQEITARDELMERKSGWRQNDIMAYRNNSRSNLHYEVVVVATVENQYHHYDEALHTPQKP